MSEKQIDQAFKDIGALEHRLQQVEAKQADLEDKISHLDGKVTVLITMNSAVVVTALIAMITLVLKRRITQKFYSTFILRL